MRKTKIICTIGPASAGEEILTRMCRSGITVRMVSRFRCPEDIVGMTTSQKAWRKLNLSWGVTHVMSDEFDSVDVMFYHAARHAMDILGLKSGDNIILTGGQASKQSGSTNTIRLETIK